MKQEIMNALIQAGVKNLRTFGYKSVNKDNILTDRVFASFFCSMLEEHKGNTEEVEHLRAVIDRNKGDTS